uniref:DNA-directed RNA polymerase subunit A n=1 Tax=Lygus hesperus TaxID=30085 RepID=A0A0A9X7K4_LYGHE
MYDPRAPISPETAPPHPPHNTYSYHASNICNCNRLQPSTSSSAAPSQERRIFTEQDIRNLLNDLESDVESDEDLFLHENLETGESDEDDSCEDEIPIIDLTPQRNETEERGLTSIFEEELAEHHSTPQTDQEGTATPDEEEAEIPSIGRYLVVISVPFCTNFF